MDLSKLTSKDQATAIVERIQRHIVKDFSGWIVEEGILQVPKVGEIVPQTNLQNYLLFFILVIHGHRMMSIYTFTSWSRCYQMRLGHA